jgi:hypothetical protein
MLLAAITLFAGPACAADSTAPPAASGPAAAAASGEPQPAAKPQADGGSQAPDYKIDPLAQRIVGRACATLAESKVFTFHAEITFDEVLPSLAKLQFAAATDYAVRKPNDLAVDYESDLGAKRFWYNGGTLTIFDVPKMMYISTAVPSSIDAMLERVAERNNLTLPLADFALSDPCKHLSNRVLFGSYVGRGDVGGVACDHLAFAESNIDWQIWIQRSGKALPRKVVINYRTTPGLPQYTAVISDWKFPPTIPDARFVPEIPKKAVRIKFVDLKELRQ